MRFLDLICFLYLAGGRWPCWWAFQIADKRCKGVAVLRVRKTLASKFDRLQNITGGAILAEEDLELASYCHVLQRLQDVLGEICHSP